CWRRQLVNEPAISRCMRPSGDIVVQSVPMLSSSTGCDSVSEVRSTLFQYGIIVGVVAAVTVAAFVFTPIVGPHATALVFLLTVVLLAVVVQRGPALAAAALSALSWDYFFLPPVLAFRVSHFEDAMLLGMYFVMALVLGRLTARIRAQQDAERARQERAK